MNINIRCKDCNGKIVYSKLDSSKFICKKCNGIYKIEDTKRQSTLNEYGDKNDKIRK